MTSVPGHPGASAVVLYREEIANDNTHRVDHYFRIKVLTDAGRKNAEVAIEYSRATYDMLFGASGTNVINVSGRTIHADGRVIPFTGKPYAKVVDSVRNYGLENTSGDVTSRADFSTHETVFTLPEVEVGSILEYRYTTEWSVSFWSPPDWIIQGDLYIKAAHFMWYPAVDQTRSLTWFLILPPGANLQHEGQAYELTVHDVPPSPTEELMPPMDSLSYRVLFNYVFETSIADYWKTEGEEWFKGSDDFAGVDGAIKKATEDCTAGAVTQDEKLRKIYALVMGLENTDYTRKHEREEEKKLGAGKLDRVSDVLSRKSGDERQITQLFQAMAKAAGIKTDLMLVPDRSKRQFNKEWLTFDQFDRPIAVAMVDGKELFLDPGSRYVPYGQLAWQHTLVEGLRQTSKGAIISATPGASFDVNKLVHVANLTLNRDGGVTGTIDFSYSGAPAVGWRQALLRGDEDELKHSLRRSLERMLPKTVEVEVLDIKNTDDIEKPLLVKFSVKGTLGAPAGKRLLLPIDLFRSGETATFPEEKRDLPVYFHYPEATVDVLRLILPKELALEVPPTAAKYSIKGTAAYSMATTVAASSVTVRRDFVFNESIIPATNYVPLREFYSQFEAKDKESMVLKAAPAEGNGGTAGGQ